jgi:uridine phosphorylase
MTYPILEFDPTPQAVIEPSKILRRIPLPRCAVPCFFQEVITKVIAEHHAEVAFTMKSELGPHPIYTLDYKGSPVTIFHPGVGAPLAAGILEEAIALGCECFVACGGAGVLNKEIAVGHLVLPTAAVRDEGTSYHYLPPSREVTADPVVVGAIQATLQAHGVPYLPGKTWTTDAFYRETPEKVQRRRAEGCLTVEMEAAAFFAVAQFRKVRFGQILYGGDDVSAPEWDHRGWQSREEVREHIFWLAVEACLAVGE